MANTIAKDFCVQLNDLSKSDWVERVYSHDLQPNQLLLEIDKFSFTSNNITYGVVGKRMNYWEFFPTEAGYGIIPAWGFANVIASEHPEIAVGQKYYGYYPMSSHLLVTAKSISKAGFTDFSEHRRELPAVYNFYTHTAYDPGYAPEAEALICLFRPLFITSFLIEAHLKEMEYYGARHILLTSASSKTAQALAYLLNQHKAKTQEDFKIIGLTSERNKGYVNSLGWHDETLSYDDFERLPADQKHVVIDFTGNHQTQLQLQAHLKESLMYNCMVGLVDWQNLKGEKPSDFKGEFFFAPTHAARRQKEWGPKGFQQKVGAAWLQFTAAIKQSLSIREVTGKTEFEQLYQDMLAGNIDPRQGNIVSIR